MSIIWFWRTLPMCAETFFVTIKNTLNMNFKELQQGYSVYVFDRKNLTCKACPVQSVSQPRFESKIGMQPQMVVDLTINTDSASKTFVVSDTSSRAYADNLVIVTDKQSAIAEIRAVKQSADNFINSVETHRQTSVKCEALLSELDTEFQNQKHTEERLSGMEAQIKELSRLITEKLGKR